MTSPATAPATSPNPPRARRGAGSLLLAAVLVAIVTGCAHKRLDTSRAESLISAKLSKAYSPIEVGRTRCPSRLKLSKGGTFDCRTDVGGSSVGIAVTQSDAAGHVTFVTRQAVISTAKVEADLASKLHAAYDEPGNVMSITVNCPGAAVRVLAAESTFRCNVTASAQHLVEEVTVKGTTGNITYRALS